MKKARKAPRVSPIKQWRGVKGLSQQDLCEEAKLTRAALVRIEQNKAKPQQKSLESIAQAMGLSVEELTAGPMKQNMVSVTKMEDLPLTSYAWKPYEDKEGKRRTEKHYDLQGVLNFLYSKRDKKEEYFNFRIVDADRDTAGEVLQIFDMVRKADRRKLEKIIKFIDKTLKKT